MQMKVTAHGRISEILQVPRSPQPPVLEPRLLLQVNAESRFLFRVEALLSVELFATAVECAHMKKDMLYSNLITA